ncbi:hypothetical protein ABEB22_03550 [Thioclava sp. 'Guangxiensis']|uniref:hypothetical protein n=1 Tax=Thioclava sp. 'Guangxiensis' TaxID=3149044 RepID=UPI0038783AD7
MLIDNILPDFHFQETHSILIDAPASRIMAEALVYKPEDDAFFRGAIALREAPIRGWARLRGRTHDRPAFTLDNFTPLARHSQEAVFGMVGRFWQAGYGQDPLADLQAFETYDQAGSVKLALHYHIGGEGKACLTTRTRIYCLDEAARVNFARYWMVIRPVSGLIRRRVLKTIKRRTLGT